MAKETKIGLVVIASMLVVLTAAIAIRISRAVDPGDETPTASVDEAETTKTTKKSDAPKILKSPAGSKMPVGIDSNSTGTAESVPSSKNTYRIKDRKASRYGSVYAANEADSNQSATSRSPSDRPTMRLVAADSDSGESSISPIRVVAESNAAKYRTAPAGAGHSTVQQAAELAPIPKSTGRRYLEAAAAEYRQKASSPAAPAKPYPSQPYAPSDYRQALTPATAPSSLLQSNSLRQTNPYADPQAYYQQQPQPPYAEPTRDIAQVAQVSPAQNADGDAGYLGAGGLHQMVRGGTGGRYVVKPNDNFWTISQAVYGRGDYFKALMKHNEEEFPVPEKLAVGDEVSVPSHLELRAAYPGLCPKPRRQSAPVTQTALPPAGGRVYEVKEGDTLFNIARYELGDPARWIDIYRLNQRLLTDDFNYVKPGLQLVLPGRARRIDSEKDRFTRETDQRRIR